MDYGDQIRAYLNHEIEIMQKLNVDELNEAMNALELARKRNARIYVMGNGGSAATASHFVCDFNKGIWEEKKDARFHVQCLSDNTPMMMAIANDLGYDQIFVYQLAGVLCRDDLVVAISGSGNSANVIEAVEYAKTVGCKVVGITGYDGGKLRQLADYHMYVPDNDMQIVEDIHMTFDHMMMRILGNER